MNKDPSAPFKVAHDDPKPSQRDTFEDEVETCEDQEAGPVESAKGCKPSTLDYITRALEHKERGNQRFKEGSHELASEDYAVGLEVLNECDSVCSNAPEAEKVDVTEVRVSLLLNRAMALLKLERWSEAATSAGSAIKAQPENVKALYRRGVARARLGHNEAALKDLAQAFELEPSNREAKRELALVRDKVAAKRSADKKRLKGALQKGKGLYRDVEAERERRKVEEEAALAVKRRRHAEANDERKRNGQKEISFEEWSKAEDEARKKHEEDAKRNREREQREREEKRRLERLAAGNEVVVIEKDDDLKPADCRGYKVLADGRKTSYFTTVPDDQTRDLLAKSQQGPRKIEEPVDGSEQSSASGSAWNAAGTTIEERPQTKWANDALKRHLLSIQHSTPNCLIKVSSVKKLEGEASIVVSRRVPKYIFEYSATLDWEATVNKVSYKGSLLLPEISSTIVDGLYEQRMTCKKSKTAPALDDALRGFKLSVNKALADFVAEYRTRIVR